MSSGAPSSADKLVPSEPDKVMVIRRINPSILILSTPFARYGRVNIGGRGTVVTLADSSLAVFSPVALTDIVKARIQEELGSTNVKYITALDQEHHIFLESWHKQWPNATIIAPETLPAYRDKQNYFKLPDANMKLMRAADKAAGLTVDPAFDKEFDIEYVDAHPNKELVFNHKPSRTLIEADLMFNLPASEQHSRTPGGAASASSGFFTRSMIAVSNTQGAAMGQKRLLWYGVSSGDRQGFAQSVSRIAKWDFDRIIPCHGDVIESGGRGIFEKVMEWHLQQAKDKLGK